MNWFTGTATYVVCWFLIFFMVLPWGVHTPDNPEPGHATSAPIHPRIGIKVLVTTLLAFIVWGVVDYIVANNIIDFRAMVPPGQS